ncbi:MAG: hypothetical protein N2644_00875 [Candidatus Sumerlaea chitinivorans]|nr:hypothetical protein [Candidatus Sumerlaea chitinivorans]
MKRYMIAFLFAFTMWGLTAPASAGWVKNLLGLGKDEAAATAQSADKSAKDSQAGKTEKPSGEAQPTPDPEKVKKLKAALDWETPPKDLLDRYVGTWQGDFWVYTTDGRLEQRNKVRITYTLQADGTLKMEMLSGDLISKMWVTKVTATYKVDGKQIICTVVQPTGETFKQIGHYNDGSVFFVSQIPDGVEHQRERIDGKRLLVDGFGVYGSLKKKDDHHVFIGRFLKQE